MKALIHHRSLRQRLSWWLALQSFAGLGLVCLAVYLVTEFNFRDRQEETLAQKENVIRHLLVEGKEHRESEALAHKLDDFLVGHGDLSLEVSLADGTVLYAHTRNQNAQTVWRQREIRGGAGCRPCLAGFARSAVAGYSNRQPVVAPTCSYLAGRSHRWGHRCIAGRILPGQLGPGARPKTGQSDARSVG